MMFILFAPALAFFALRILAAIVNAKPEASTESKRTQKSYVTHAKRKAAPALDTQPKRKPGRPRKSQPAPVEVPATIDAPVKPSPVATPESHSHPVKTPTAKPAPVALRPYPAPSVKLAAIKGNNIFAREIVAITGDVDGMTRSEVIRAIEDNAGIVTEKIAAATMLIQGENADWQTLCAASKRYLVSGRMIKTVYGGDFLLLLKSPVSVTLDEFAALVA